MPKTSPPVTRPAFEPPSAAPQGWVMGLLIIVLMGALLALGRC